MTSPRLGGRGVPKTNDKKSHRGKRVHGNSDITTKKKYLKVFIFACFCSAWQQLNLAFWRWCHFKHWPESVRTG